MRLLLRQGTREVLVFSRNRFAQFFTEQAASEFLAGYFQNPDNVDRLRKILAATPQFAHLSDADASMVLVTVANLLVRRQVHALADGSTPWSWPFPVTPTHKGPPSTAEAEPEDLVGEDDGTEDKESDPLDWVPDSIIPPEFVIMAKLIAGCIEGATDLYGLGIDLLRFVGMGGGPLSVLADAFVELAEGQGVNLGMAAKGLGLTLIPLLGDAMPEVNPSKIARNLSDLAASAGTLIKGAAGATGDLLTTLGGSGVLPDGVSEICGSLNSVAQSQAGALLDKAESFGGDMDALADACELPVADGLVMQTFPQLSDEQSGALLDSADAVGGELDTTLEGEELDDDWTFNPEGFEAEAAEGAWVEIELKDQDGKPHRLELVKVVLQSGDVREAQTDDDGVARFEDLEDGWIKVDFPKLGHPWHKVGQDAPTPRIHVVVRGDWLSKIAKRYGIPSWRTLYDHPSNAGFKAKRPNPDLIYPGDEIVIPSLDDTGRDAPVGTTHKFEVTINTYEPPDPEPEVEPANIPEPEPEPEDLTEYYLVFNANDGLVHRVPRDFIDALEKDDKRLATIRKGIEDANKKPAAVRRAAVDAKLEELKDFTNTPPGSLGVAGIPKDKGLQEYVILSGSRPSRVLYTGGNQSNRYRQRFGATQTKIADCIRSPVFKSKAGQKLLKKANWSKSWKLAGDEGSMLDFFNDANPALLAKLGPLGDLKDWLEERPEIWRKNHKAVLGANDPRFDMTAEARFLRWTYSAKTTASVNFDQGNMKVALNAGGSVSLFEGKTEIDWYMPKDTGFAVPMTSASKHLALRIKIVGKGDAFVGVATSLDVETAACWAPTDDSDFQLQTKGNFKAFAGAKLTASATASIEWQKKAGGSWREMALVGFGITGSVGIGLEASFQLNWDPMTKEVVFSAGYNFALKVGFGQSFNAKAKLEEILQFAYVLLEGADFGKVAQIGMDLFYRLDDLVLGMAMDGLESVAEGWDYLVNGVTAFWGNQKKIRQFAENINAGRAKKLMDLGSPEAKAEAVWRLADRSALLGEGVESTAILKVLESVGSRREMIQVLKKAVEPPPKGQKKVSQSFEAGWKLIRANTYGTDEDTCRDLIKGFSLHVT